MPVIFLILLMLVANVLLAGLVGWGLSALILACFHYFVPIWVCAVVAWLLGARVKLNFTVNR